MCPDCLCLVSTWGYRGQGRVSGSALSFQKDELVALGSGQCLHSLHLQGVPCMKSLGFLIPPLYTH